MQCIIITISRGVIARNLLQNEFFELVKRRFDKVVLVTSAAEDERFRKEFGAPNVEFAPLMPERETAVGRAMNWFYQFLIWNQSTVGHGLYRYVTIPNFWGRVFKRFRFELARLFFQPLSRIPFARRLLQRFDELFLQRTEVAYHRALIRKYSPRLVFSTNILEEGSIIKAARKESVPALAMAKTWDNPSKRYFRAHADAVAVWSPFMKDEFVHLHDYRPEDVHVTGIPQFDYYADSSRRESREEFCRRMGLDPRKKILCFGSEGKIMPSDVGIMRFLADLVHANAFRRECQILIRPHFAHTGEEEKFAPFRNTPNVKIDGVNNPSQGFGDAWDYSRAQMDHFLSLLCQADILITTASTLALDAAAVGTPTVLIAFDGHEKRKFFESSARWYICDYYPELTHFNPALVAHDSAEFKDAIIRLLDNPRLLRENQLRACERLCYRLDGKAGERLFKVVERMSA